MASRATLLAPPYCILFRLPPQKFNVFDEEFDLLERLDCFRAPPSPNECDRALDELKRISPYRGLPDLGQSLLNFLRGR